MFAKIEFTTFQPKNPTMVWDGECGFCKYWITYFQKDISSNVVFSSYQEVAEQFPDIPLKEFKKASRFIETDGNVYSGPDSAYRCLFYSENNRKIWHKLYTGNSGFRYVSDYAYNFIAKNRSIMFSLTKFFFGSNPTNLKPLWLLYLILTVLILILIVMYL